MRRTCVGLVCALVLVASLLATSAAATPSARERDGWRPEAGGFFNNPWGDRAAKFRIERQVVEAIRHAHRGSYIRIAVYSFDRVNVAKALIEAHRRGVHVQVLHNDHLFTPAMKMLKRALGTNRGKKSWDYTCKTGCRSVQGVLHDKIYLFEHTGRSRNVVMTGSANLTLNATVHQFNDLLVQRNAPALHEHLLKLFWQLKKDRPAKPLYRRVEMQRYGLWVFPRVKTNNRNDPVLKILDKVTCRGARDGTGKDGRTKIRVSMHAWNGARGAYLARKLRFLYARGCDVRVMWSLAGRQMKHAIGKPTPYGRVPRRANGYNTDCDVLQQVDKYSHQKYFTISGRYDGDRSASLVFTGSSNWTAQGISGDEMILRASGAGLVKDWNSNFNFIWRNRARSVGGEDGFRPGAPECPYYYRAASRPNAVTYAGEHWEAD